MDQKTKDFYNSFKTQTVYLWSELYEAFLKVSDGKCFAKYKGGKEFQIEPGSRLFEGAMNPNSVITKDQYEKA